MSEDNKSLNCDTENTPDILIQDLEDIQKDETPVENAPEENLCLRCEKPIADGMDFCEECEKEMSAFPLRKGSIIGVLLTFIVCIFSVLLFGINSLIAHPVLKGDEYLEKGDIERCYAYYEEAYNLTQNIQKSIFTDSNLSYFSVGSKTLAKQIVALEELNGVVSAGDMIKKFFPTFVPKNLRAIKAEYDLIETFVNGVNNALSEYTETLEGAAGNYQDMSEILENIIKKNPDTPEYMTEYYRFMLAYSMNEPDTACEYLDNVIKIAPEKLWLYAGEGIAAYKKAGEYSKALSVCNKLLKVSPTDPSAVAYTVSVLRLLEKYDEALAVYQSAVNSNTYSPELERQKAIVLMLRGDTKTAEDVLINSFSTEGATLEHLATLVVCAFQNENTDVFNEYKKLLDGYVTFEQVELFIAGEITAEDIFLKDGGEIY